MIFRTALLLALFASVSIANGQNKSFELPDADPKDVETISTLLDALYETISGKEGEPRDWDRFKTLWHPMANLLMVNGESSGGSRQVKLSLDDFIKLSSAHGKVKPFFEIEVFRKVDHVGHIAQVASTYVIKESENSKEHTVRGINFFQLYHDGTRWWIISCIWENELEGMKIPDAYLGEH